MYSMILGNKEAQSLTEHLEEVRLRLFWSVAFWIAASCMCYYLVPSILTLTRDAFLNENVQLIFTRPTEAFVAYVKVAMVVGFFVSSPVTLFQFTRFLDPGLKEVERKWMYRLATVSAFLFLLGALFAFLVVLPVTLQFFLSFQTESLNPLFQVGEFLSFITGILALCGAIFQLPLLLFFASLMGVVSSKQLSEGRRIAIFLSALIAAVATPTPDVLTMSVVALPIWILFELSIILIRITGR